MNKKGVILALVAGFSINSLMVTVGQIKGQVQYAHALVGDQVRLLDGITIKTINTKVDINNNGLVSLSFKIINGNTFIDLDKNNVKDIKISKAFIHTKFKGRENIDVSNTNITNGTWNSETGTFILNSNLSQPGVYNGEIEIEYKDGSKESYPISLRKIIQDTISFTTDVQVGKIIIKNLKLNNGAGNINYKLNSENITLVNKTKDKSAKVKKVDGNDYIFDVLDLTRDGGLDLGDELELQVKYGEKNSETITSNIILVKQPKIKIEEAFMSNEVSYTDFKSKIETSIRKYYDTTLSVTNGVDPRLSNPIKIGDQTILTYKQTYNGNGKDGVGGAKLSTKVNDTNIDLTIEPVINAYTSTANYIPFATVFYDKNICAISKKKTGFMGDYTFAIGDKKVLFHDAFSGVYPTYSGLGETNDNKYHVIFKDSKGNPTDLSLYELDGKRKLQNPNGERTIKLELKDKLEHGYSVYPGVYEVDYYEDYQRVNEVNDKILSLANSKKPVENKKGDNVLTADMLGYYGSSYPYYADPVYVSLIVVADTLDGAYANTKFERIGASEGKLTLSGAKTILSGEDLNNVNLNVNNANIGLLTGESKGNDLVFNIKFNGQIPKNIDWNLTVKNSNVKLSGNVNTRTIEAVNITSAKATNVNTSNLSDEFEVDIVFNIEDKGRVKVDNKESNRVSLNEFNNGQHIAKYEVGEGKYQGVYNAGLLVSKGNFTLEMTAKSDLNNSISLLITPTNLVNGAVEKVNEAVIEYRESVESGQEVNPWTKANVNFELTGDKKELKDKTGVTKVVTGLTPGKKYDFRVVYRVKNASTVEEEVMASVFKVQLTSSVINNSGNGLITGTGNVGNGIITGTGNNNSSNNINTNSTGTVNITSTTSNTTTSADAVSVTLPSNVKYDMNKPATVGGFSYKDKNGKVVKESAQEYSNVTVKFENGKVVVSGLVPGKYYDEVTVNFTDDKGANRTIVVKNPMIKAATGSSQEYLANVYTVSLGRPADEAGYNYHLSNLTNKKTTLSNFLLNMLSEKEFGELYKTPEAKIEALYGAIVARDSDAAGKKFWTDEYKKMLSVYGSQEATLRAIADRMVNEKEVKELANRLGVNL